MHFAAPQPLAFNADGRITIPLQVVDLGAGLAQGIHQMADGALFHARLAGQGKFTAAQALPLFFGVGA